MKSTLEPSAPKQKPTFPCLKRNVIDGTMIVLFIGNNTGTVVKENSFDLGYYSDGWANFDDVNVWEPYNGKVILESE